MPVSPDGEKPIETEVISGQSVDMNNEFVQFLIRSIILSFGVPSVVVDEMDQVELAKTLSMSNLDIARTVLEAQLEILPAFTKLIRTIIQYEIPNYSGVSEVEASLNPPTAIVLEMNKDLIDSVQDMAEKLADLLIGEDDEQPSARNKRLFKLAYFKANTPTLDWDTIMKVVDNIKVDSKELELNDSLIKTQQANQDNQDNGTDQSNLGDSSSSTDQNNGGF